MAEEIKFGIRLTGNSKEAVAAVRETRAEIEKLGAGSGKMASQYSGMSAAQDKVAASARRNSAEYRKLDSDLTRLLASLDPAYRATLQLDAANDLLHRGLKEGLITQKQYEATLGQIGRQLGTTATGLNATGLSAKQTAFALRQVPMQFTDIATSLAAGQNPIQVFLQQGGQLKDLFGGVGAAASAMGRYMLGLVNPITVAIGAVIGLTAAFEGGRREMRAMDNALTVTGNFANTTRGAMRVLAEDISASGAITIGTAKEIVTQLVASGRFGAQTIDGLATLAADFAAATRRDVDEVTPELVKLFEDPAKGAAELNRQMHFLTTVEQEHIAHLVRIGQEEQARLVLSEKLREHIKGTSENLGTLERAWNAIKSAASDAWDAMLGIGREISLEEQIKKMQAEMVRAAQSGNAIRTQFLAGQIAELQGKEDESARAEGAAAKSTEERAKWYDAIRKSQAYHLKELRDELTLVQSKSPANAEESAFQKSRIAEIRKQIADAQKGGKSGKEDDWYADLENQQAAMGYAQLVQMADAANKQLAESAKEAAEAIQRQAEAMAASDAVMRASDNLALATLEQESAAEQDRLAGMERQAQAVRELLDPTIKLHDEIAKVQALGSMGLLDPDEVEAAIRKIEEMNDKVDDSKNFMKDLGATFTSAFEDAIIGGKKFSDVLAGLAQDIERLLTRRFITDPLMKGLDSLVIDPLSDWLGGLTGSANGNVFEGAPGLHQYANTVQTSPKVFGFDRMRAFASGGVFAEAGPEAVMPLKRMSSGRLGVEAAGGGSNVTVNVIEAPGKGGQVERGRDGGGNEIITVMVETVRGALIRDIATEGSFSTAMQGRFGLSRVHGAQR